MADFLLVVEGLMADGADAAMMVDESTYLAALFGHVFAPDDGAVLGYVWCSKHGWVRGDEARICESCCIEAMEAQLEMDWPEDWDEEDEDYEVSQTTPTHRVVFRNGQFLCEEELTTEGWISDAGADRMTDEEEEDLFFYWLYT
jgi:hypothetical protein